MASPRMTRFIIDCQAQITNVLQFADSFDALKHEYATFSTNGVALTDADVAELGVTATQFTQSLVAFQEVVDYCHVSTRAAKLYRLKR